MRIIRLLSLVSVVVVAGSVTACSNQTWDAIYQTWELSGSGKKDARLTDNYIRNLPYASLLVAIEPKVEALLVLESYDNKKMQWRASNEAIIVTEGGRLVSVQIESVNYRLHPASNSEDPVRSQSWQTDTPYRLVLDMPHLGVYQQIFNCQLSEKGNQAFTTPLRQGTAKVYQEACYLSDGRFTQVNEYWVDIQNAAIVKAKQGFHPQLSGAIVFSEAKPLGWQAK